MIARSNTRPSREPRVGTCKSIQKMARKNLPLFWDIRFILSTSFSLFQSLFGNTVCHKEYEYRLFRQANESVFPDMLVWQASKRFYFLVSDFPPQNVFPDEWFKTVECVVVKKKRVKSCSTPVVFLLQLQPRHSGNMTLVDVRENVPGYFQWSFKLLISPKKRYFSVHQLARSLSESWQYLQRPTPSQGPYQWKTSNLCAWSL